MSTYTYTFQGEFDENIFNAGPVSDAVFRDEVLSVVDNIIHVLKCNSGIPNFSSIVTYNGNDYTIVVNRR